MPLMFNSILREVGIEPKDVRLLRHKDRRATKGFTCYDLWCTDRPGLEAYQSTQSFDNQAALKSPYWASFVGTPSHETFFFGLYRVKHLGRLAKDKTIPTRPRTTDRAGTCDEYQLTLDQRFKEFDGKLFIRWASDRYGYRTWIQKASKQNKPVTELRARVHEPEFPGFLNFVERVSKLDILPATWISVLKASRGIYLLTCPKTGKQYVGSATGEFSFWGRWQNYSQNGHGGNKRLREHIAEYGRTDFWVSVLEVAGTATTEQNIVKDEQRWMKRLQSKRFGLNCE